MRFSALCRIVEKTEDVGGGGPGHYDTPGENQWKLSGSAADTVLWRHSLPRRLAVTGKDLVMSERGLCEERLAVGHTLSCRPSVFVYVYVYAYNIKNKLKYAAAC